MSLRKKTASGRALALLNHKLSSGKSIRHRETASKTKKNINGTQDVNSARHNRRKETLIKTQIQKLDETTSNGFTEFRCPEATIRLKKMSAKIRKSDEDGTLRRGTTNTALHSCGTERSSDLSTYIKMIAKATRRDTSEFRAKPHTWLATDIGDAVVARLKYEGIPETWLIIGKSIVPKVKT